MLREKKLIQEKKYFRALDIFTRNLGLFYQRMNDQSLWSPQKKAALETLVKGTSTANLAEHPVDHTAESLPVTLPEQQSGNTPQVTAEKELNLSHLTLWILEDEHHKIPVGTTHFQIRVDVIGQKPPVWRRFFVPAGTTFQQLHEILLILFQHKTRQRYYFKTNTSFYSDDPTHSQAFHILEKSGADHTIDKEMSKKNRISYVCVENTNLQLTLKLEAYIECENAQQNAPLFPFCSKMKSPSPAKNPHQTPEFKLDINQVNRTLMNFKKR